MKVVENKNSPLRELKFNSYRIHAQHSKQAGRGCGGWTGAGHRSRAVEISSCLSARTSPWHPPWSGAKRTWPWVTSFMKFAVHGSTNGQARPPRRSERKLWVYGGWGTSSATTGRDRTLAAGAGTAAEVGSAGAVAPVKPVREARCGRRPADQRHTEGTYPGVLQSRLARSQPGPSRATREGPGWMANDSLTLRPWR